MLQKGNDANGYVVQQAWTTGRLETTGYEFIGMYTLKTPLQRWPETIMPLTSKTVRNMHQNCIYIFFKLQP
jgi:hypothetical protein